MENSTANRPRHPHRALSARRQIVRPGRDAAAVAVIRGALAKAGLDLAQFDDMRSRGRADLQSALAQYRAAADERAPAMSEVVARSLALWQRGKRVSPDTVPSDFYSLSTADAITATSNINFVSQTVAPFANTAEITVDQQTDDVGYLDEFLEFLFSWQNTTGQDVTCTLTGVLGVTATAVVTAGGYWWPLVPTPASELNVVASLGVTVVDIFGEITSPPYQSTQAQQVAHLLTDGAWTEGTIVGQDIFRGYVLQYLDLFVPANGRLDLSLNCEINWLALDGGCQFVAAGRGRQVTGFGVFINTEPAPPLAV